MYFEDFKIRATSRVRRKAELGFAGSGTPWI